MSYCSLEPAVRISSGLWLSSAHAGRGSEALHSFHLVFIPPPLVGAQKSSLVFTFQGKNKGASQHLLLHTPGHAVSVLQLSRRPATPATFFSGFGTSKQTAGEALLTTSPKHLFLRPTFIRAAENGLFPHRPVYTVNCSRKCGL